MANRTTIHSNLGLTTDSLISPLRYSRGMSMLNFLRHASDRGRKQLVLTVDDFEHHIILLLVAAGNVMLKSCTKTTTINISVITILVEKP